MKKLISIIAIVTSVIICTLFSTSCSTNSANFKFNLTVKGNIENPNAPFVGTFDTNIANDIINVNDVDIVYTLESPEASNVSKWLNKQVKRVFLRKLNVNTLYEISALGYVEEKSTGIKVSINKVWTNK